MSMGHEYGHAAHHKAFGGGVISPGCPEPHNLQDPTNYDCAFSEGFANFHALETIGGEMGEYYTRFVNNNDFVPGTDGALWESVVASALWHLTRGTSLNGAITPSYVATLMQSGCKVWNPDFVGLVPPQGMDHMVYCLERRNPVSVLFQNALFSGRNATIGAFLNVPPPSNYPSVLSLRAVWGQSLRGYHVADETIIQSPINPTIHGPQVVAEGVAYNYSVTATGGTGPYTYEWITPVSSSSSTIQGGFCSDGFIEVRVSDAESTAIATMQVIVSPQVPPPEPATYVPCVAPSLQRGPKHRASSRMNSIHVPIPTRAGSVKKPATARGGAHP